MSLKWGSRCLGSYFLTHSKRQFRAATLDSARSELNKLKRSVKLHDSGGLTAVFNYFIQALSVTVTSVKVTIRQQ